MAAVSSLIIKSILFLFLSQFPSFTIKHQNPTHIYSLIIVNYEIDVEIFRA